MPQEFAALKAAAIDGRTHNIFHRQTQLERLHNAIQTESAAIQEAIIKDGAATPVEAAVEYYATIKCVKAAYESLNPVEAFALEYDVVSGKNSPNSRKPVGIVYIEPIRHNFFYSAISPLSSAIAAGNCVVVLIQRNLRASSPLLSRLLTEALEKDTFAVAEDAVTSELPKASTIRVIQDSTEQFPDLNEVVSSSNAPVIAIVDRTANLQLAAKELVAARFAFRGNSPYAPDLVLVNEFVRQDFLRAVVQECVGYSSDAYRGTNGTVNGSIKKRAHSNMATILDDVRNIDSDLRIVVQEANLAVVEIQSRKSLLSIRLRAPVLAVHSIRSIDDAIELISQNTRLPCSAAYYFSNPQTGKYLCQFVSAEASFINHVPRELLLGPLGPSRHPLDLGNRYPSALFTLPAPQYIVPTTENVQLATTFQAQTTTEISKLAAEADKPLSVTKRASGAGVGFFEQGLLINVTLILTASLVTSVAGVLYLRKFFR